MTALRRTRKSLEAADWVGLSAAVLSVSLQGLGLYFGRLEWSDPEVIGVGILVVVWTLIIAKRVSQ